jgi:hypothetical protein
MLHVTHNLLHRRPLLTFLALPALAGCANVLPETTVSATTPEAQAMLEASAAAHGLAAFQAVADLSVSYAGEWPPLINRLQPALVDRGFRARSEERLLPREGVVAQSHVGPAGRKQVIRQSVPGAQGNVRVWFNGEEAHDEERRAAAALVADGYALFLLGPMLLVSGWANSRTAAVEHAGVERIFVDGRRWTCDILRARVRPGLGFSPSERLALWVDRDEGLMRRLRFSLEGLASTRGAVAEVDASDHIMRYGVRWPTRFHERLLRPFSLPVHDWQLTGLDLNRGLQREDLDGAAFHGRAIRPAAALG